MYSIFGELAPPPSMVRDLVSQAWELAERASINEAKTSFQLAIHIDQGWFAECEYADFLGDFYGAQSAVEYWEERYHQEQTTQFTQRPAVSVCNQVAEYYRELNLHAAARRWQQRALKIEMKSISRHGLSDASTYGFACDLLNQGQNQSARTMFIALSRSSPARSQYICDLAALKLAELAIAENDLQTAEELTQHIALRSGECHPPKLMISLLKFRSQLYERLSEYEKALSLIENAAKIAKRNRRCRRMLPKLEHRKRMIERTLAVVLHDPQWN